MGLWTPPILGRSSACRPCSPLCTSLLKRSVRSGIIVVVEINLGGSIEPIHNAVTLAEIAVEKGATALSMGNEDRHPVLLGRQECTAKGHG